MSEDSSSDMFVSSISDLRTAGSAVMEAGGRRDLIGILMEWLLATNFQYETKVKTGGNGNDSGCCSRLQKQIREMQ